MSLLSKAFETLTILNKSIVDDGYGGTKTVYTDGLEIQGALVLNSSPQMKIAQALGSKGAYTLTVKKAIELDFHTVLRRESDGLIVRLVSNSDDKKTPEGAGLDMRQYSAEEFVLGGSNG